MQAQSDPISKPSRRVPGYDSRVAPRELAKPDLLSAAIFVVVSPGEGSRGRGEAVPYSRDRRKTTFPEFLQLTVGSGCLIA